MTARPMPAARLPLLYAAAISVLALLHASPSWAQTARLTFEQVFGAAASSLVVPFGVVDAQCTSPPATGVTCFADPAGAYATWYGTVQFRVRVTAFPGGTVRLVGHRQAGGSMASGRLLHGASGVPATPYPTTPAAPLTLATAIGSGNTLITRVVGLRVTPADAAGAWATQVVYSLIVE